MQRFKKFFRKEVIIIVLVGIGVVFSLRYILTSKFTSIVEPLFIPNIPEQYYTYMDSQIPRTIDLACGAADFKWFDYYDAELKTEVKVKRSGFCSYHYHSLTNSSMRIKYLNEDIRLKAFASEMNIVDNPFNSFSNLFSEYSVYTVLQSLPETRKYSPDARIVSINNDPEDIRVRWLDSTPDTVRETDQVQWKDLTRIYKYAPELAELYFDVAWKTRDSKISGLSGKFTDLLRPIFDSFDKPLDGTEVTGFNNEDFMRFLALATTVGSTHINDHNLIFVADRKEDENKQVHFEWYPMLTDTNGFYFISEPLIPTFGYNPITEFFMRNPARVYEYFKYLHEYNELVLGSGVVSKHYEKFDCSNILRNKHFPNLLLQATHKDFITSDINGYCAAVEVFKDYDDKQYSQLKNKLDSASLHWNIYQAPGEANPVLVAWSFTPVPVKLNRIKCSNVDCTKDFQLINEPWWDKHTPEGVLSGEMTRLHSGNGNYAPKFSKYFYKFRYVGGGDFPNPDSISISSENAITEVRIHSVKDPFPVVDISIERSPDVELGFILTGDLLNPVNSEYSITEETAADWKVDVYSSVCKLAQNAPPKYLLDCSDLDPSIWPHPLSYIFRVFHKNSKVREKHGELFFKNITPVSDVPVITNDSVDDLILADRSALSDALGRAVNYSEDGESSFSNLAFTNNVYYVPPNTTYDVRGTLDLADSTLIIDQGASLEFWPMAGINVGNLIVLGQQPANAEEALDAEETEAPDLTSKLVKKPGMPGWHSIEIGNAAYIQNALIADSLDINNGVVHGENVKYLGVYGTNFLNNKSNIHCSNCTIEVNNTIMRKGTWGIKSLNSIVDSDFLACFDMDYCLKVVDNVQNVTNLDLININSWAVRVEGPSTELSISKINVRDNVSALFSKRGYPEINFDKDGSNISKAGVEMIHYDSDEIYSHIINQSHEDFERLNTNLVERDGQIKSRFYLKNKQVFLEEDLLVPVGVELVIRPGTEVNLGRDVSILSYGRIKAVGDENNKITFKSSHKKGRSWGLILLKGQSATGEFDHVIVDNGGFEYLVGLDYTGALTADHAQKLVVKSSTFVNNTGDDGLNCKYTLCEVSNNTFENNSFDGVDFDFATEGSFLRDNVFINNGNDAIDLSFDESLILNNTVNGSGDKCISVGEGSNSTIIGNDLTQCEIGIQAKDGSTINALRNRFEQNETDLHAYRKKVRFGVGGTVNAYGSEFVDKRDSFSADPVSEVNIFDEIPSELQNEFGDYLN